MNFGHDPVLVMRPFCARCGRALDAEGQHVESMTERFKREAQEEKQTEKALGVAQFQAAPKYAGEILWCMAGKVGSRTPPYRCRNKPSRLLRDAIDGSPMVACSGCAHKLRLTRYRGWGGDPRPFMPAIESEYLDLL